MSLSQPPPPNCQSEVALLLWQIEQEYSAADVGLHGLSQGSLKHEVITSKMERVADYSQRLQALVGPEEGRKLTVKAMNRAGGESADGGDGA